MATPISGFQREAQKRGLILDESGDLVGCKDHIEIDGVVL